jgi:D-aminopeptidase
MNNLITDVPGLSVGGAEDARLASGVSVVVFDAPATAGVATPGGAPALRPAHAPADGDIVFTASTARVVRTPTLRDLTEIGTLAAECVARSIARGVYEATPLPFSGALPSWKGRYGQ